MKTQQVKLSSVASIISGGTPTKSRPEYWDGNIPWISAKTMKTAKINTSNLFITEEGLLRGSNLAPAGSILVLTRGSELFNRVPICYVTHDVAFNQDVKCIIPAEVVDSKFLYYSLINRGSYISEKVGVTGIGAGKVETDVLQNLIIDLPNKSMQRAIVEQVRVYDDKIDSNNINIETVETMLLFLYRSWFSDFNYPGATGEMRKSENLQTSVPKEWTEVKFGKFLTPCSERIGDVNAPIYSTTNNGIALRDEKFNKSLSKSQNNNKKIVKDDLIFGLSREILNFGVVTAEIGSVSPVYQIFKIDQTVFLPFMLELEIRLNMPQYMDLLQLGAREGQGINRDYLLNKYILVPDMGVQGRFAEIYVATHKKIEKLKEENTVLAEIRDTLLPKLMSGELPVKVGED